MSKQNLLFVTTLTSTNPTTAGPVSGFPPTSAHVHCALSGGPSTRATRYHNNPQFFNFFQTFQEAK